MGQQDGEGWQDPYLTGDPALYPEPQAAEAVPRAVDLAPDPSLAAVPADAKPLAAGENDSVRVELMRVIRGDEIAGTPAPEGMEAVILVTRWTNIHPRELVEKSKLEGKTDRTFGAGGLFAGGGGGAAAREMVEIDVAYKVPKPVQHAFLVAHGVATDMRVEGAALPNGIAAKQAFSISRFNESREARLAYFVPRGTANLVFRFFDYSNGHITLAVAGDQALALAPPDLSGSPAGTLPELKLAVHGLRFDGDYLGNAAPAGWRFALVDVVGRGEAQPGKMGAIATVDPTRSAWLAGDAGFVAWGLPPADGERAVSFTPEIFQRRVFGFLV
ncbi:MAG: hypothetical protein OEO83_18580, partial [Alphaproteobacteria bacterium]|nr:hypothetical protein [Alphaproteobacteria bacterium]